MVGGGSKIGGIMSQTRSSARDLQQEFKTVFEAFYTDVGHFIFRSDQGSLQPKALWFIKIY